MKKYKLIKEYPGSPKVDTILNYTGNSWDDDNQIAVSLVQSSTFLEFWQEVVEKNYEILSLARLCSIKPTITDVSDYGDGYIEALLKCDNARIHSVKRLSDGEVFTIGEYLEDLNHGRTLIKEISLEESIINPGIFKIKIWSCAECYSTPIKGSNYGFNYIEDVIKHKQPLFTTEDGIDIFEGDTFYYVKFKENRFSAGRVFEIVTAKIPGCVYEPQYEKYFSTIEKAKEYILMNKKSLSPNDILKVWSKLSGHSVESLLKNSKLMHRIITSIK